MKSPHRTVHQYGDHVDTDVIIPARYLNDASDAHLAKHCLIDLDAEFATRAKPGDVIVAGANFGCGSSREHAPLALKAAGISCVIAKSFARIFLRNAVNVGLTVIEANTDALSVKTGDLIAIDFDAGQLTHVATGHSVDFKPLPDFIKAISAAGGLMPYVSRSAAQELPVPYQLALLPGDGIGPEIMTEAVKVLEAVSKRFHMTFQYERYPIGGDAIDHFDTPLPESTLIACQQADAVLLGAVGGPQWDDQPKEKRPETGLLGLRKGLKAFCNLRPVKVFPALADACPLKHIDSNTPLDFLIVRELTGGIYFGDRGQSIEAGCLQAWDVERYSVSEIDRVAEMAFQAAGRRRRSVTSIDKANVLESSRLWRQTVTTKAAAYPELSVTHQYVDNCAMQLILNPAQYDVILTSNLFGDILSDEASTLVGSIGLMPSASLGDGTGIYEPIHGSAPELAGKNIANPIGMILSAAMMLRHSLNRPEAADVIENAVSTVLESRSLTADLATHADRVIGTSEMGTRIAELIFL